MEWGEKGSAVEYFYERAISVITEPWLVALMEEKLDESMFLRGMIFENSRDSRKDVSLRLNQHAVCFLFNVKLMWK